MLYHIYPAHRYHDDQYEVERICMCDMHRIPRQCVGTPAGAVEGRKAGVGTATLASDLLDCPPL